MYHYRNVKKCTSNPIIVFVVALVLLLNNFIILHQSTVTISCDLQVDKSEAGVTFDNYFFDNSFVFLRQFKNRSFLGISTVHKKVEIRINRT